MTKVLHTGDTHIGYRQYGSDERRADFLRAFGRVVDDAIEGEYDALVHAGDLFHSRNPRLEDLKGAIDEFARLDDADIEVLAIVGNHESKRDAQWLDLLEGLGFVRRLGREPVVIGDVAFYGVDHTPPSRAEDFDYGFEMTDAHHAVLVLHGLFEPFPFGDWELSEFVENAPVEWDAVLLGDYHHPERAEVGDEAVPAAYCGSTERASTDEEGARGYNVVEFNGGVSVTRRSVETRDFVTMTADVTGATDGTGEVVERTREYDVDGAVVVVDVEGDASLTVVQSDVEESLRERGALVARVRDRRDSEERATADVTFADPDEAVRERIDAMDLSDEAREIDDVVREGDVARTNLADEVEERVEEVIESRDNDGDEGSTEGTEEDTDSEQPGLGDFS